MAKGEDLFSSTLFADLIIPRPFPNLFTYRIPSELTSKIQVGFRVVVPFGKGAGNVLTALVVKIHHSPPQKYEAKSVLEVLDEQASVNAIQIQFMNWISAYYMCHIGEVLQAALPSGLKISSEMRVQINPQLYLLEKDEKWLKFIAFTENESFLISELKARETMSYVEVASLLTTKNPYKIIHSLVRKEAVLIFDEIKEKYKPKIIKKVRFSEKYLHDKSAFEYLLNQLEKQPKRLEIILECINRIKPFSELSNIKNEAGIDKSELTALFSSTALNTLISTHVLEEFSIIQSRIDEFSSTHVFDKMHELSAAQQKSYNEIVNHFEKTDTVLLHGITGSGKTEVYIKLIHNVLEQGSQVLFLLPEIALTTQIVLRLKRVFGNRLGVYHSKYSDNERVEVWKGIQNGKIDIVVGVRSSIFLPFDNLGLIIIDEEHEQSYKQHDPAPRYHARDAALVLAKLHHAKTLLGSATPAIESYYNTQTEKWALVNLSERFSDAKMPQFQLVDVKKDKLSIDNFSPELLTGIKKALDKKEQVILFQNRRGYSPYISCQACGFVPECKSCNVSLTFHLYRNQLTCHYCGHHEKTPKVCVACGSSNFKTVGFGTEKLEEDAQLHLPTARIQRMDLDTTRTKFGYQKIINAVENEEIDILVGTQMVTKGLDFEKVSLVGVFDVDRMIHFPDFRSNERVFNLLTQVAGRAGRKHTEGNVIIQTAQPTHPIFLKVIQNDYFGLYSEEIIEREKFNYPPFSRIIKIVIKDKDSILADEAAHKLAELLRTTLGSKRILGPEPPLIDKIRDFYLREIFIKIEKAGVDIKKCKTLIINQLDLIREDKKFKNTILQLDVDVI
ncbi:MAG: primosomal protein N' [Bacteroidetes bacterium]|nr:MAG: primosomal protein N' [Bacteroidota bacterium]